MSKMTRVYNSQSAYLASSNTLRIALTITELDPGGAEQCLVHLARYLAGRNHQVEVLALGPTPNRSLGATPQRELLTSQLDQANIPWKCGPARGMASVFSVTRWLRTELNRIQPDIIQSMLFHGNFVTALANRQHNIPHVGGARVSQSQRWRQVAQRWAVGRMRTLVCVSQSVANHCHQVEGVPAQKLVVIPNGVQELEISRRRPDALVSCLPTAETPFLLFVGRLSEQKGIQPLLEHLDALLLPLPNHHLILLGDGPLMPVLQQLVGTSKVASRVHLVGWQPEARSWMPHASLLILPSRYEGMPNVVLEAMQSGIPVVTFDVEGIQELLGENNPQVVSSGVPQFVERVRELACDQQLSASLGQANKQRVDQHFQLEVQLAKYEQLYLQVLNDGG